MRVRAPLVRTDIRSRDGVLLGKSPDLPDPVEDMEWHSEDEISSAAHALGGA
jgi:hypothetical protein